MLFRSLMVEGGAQVAGFLLEHNLVDFAHLFYGPKIFGGRGIHAFPGNKELDFSIFRTKKMADSYLIEGGFSCLQES